MSLPLVECNPFAKKTGATSENIDWVLIADTHCRREGGEVHVETTNSSGVINFSLASSFTEATGQGD